MGLERLLKWSDSMAMPDVSNAKQTENLIHGLAISIPRIEKRCITFIEFKESRPSDLLPPGIRFFPGLL